jgi:serine/threonine protein kinase
MAFSLSDFSNITELRRGGMGRLYHAVQTSLDRQVVIKEMSQGDNYEPDWNRRFENEARAAAALEHDNIIRIYDYWICRPQRCRLFCLTRRVLR